MTFKDAADDDKEKKEEAPATDKVEAVSAGVGTDAKKKAITKPGELSNEIKRISTKLSCW